MKEKSARDAAELRLPLCSGTLKQLCIQSGQVPRDEAPGARAGARRRLRASLTGFRVQARNRIPIRCAFWLPVCLSRKMAGPAEGHTGLPLASQRPLVFAQVSTGKESVSEAEREERKDGVSAVIYYLPALLCISYLSSSLDSLGI